MESQGFKINIKDELFKYLRHWYWIVLSVFVALFITYFFLRYTKDLYQTAAKIQILDNSNAAFKLPTEGVSIFGSGKVNLENQIEIMKSSRIIGAVADSLHLTTTIYSVGKIKSNELWKNAPFKVVWAVEKDSLSDKSTSFEITITENGYTIAGNPKEFHFGVTNFDAPIPFKLILNSNTLPSKINGKSYLITLIKEKNLIQSIARNLEIDYVGNQSEILKISLIGENSDKINTIVNTLINVFNEDGIKDRQLVFKKTIEFVDERFEYLFNELDSIERNKANYKKENELSYIESDAGLSMQTYHESETKLDNAKAQVALSKIMLLTLNKTVGYELLPSNIGIENNEINGLVANYNDQILKRNKLLNAGGGEANPMVKEASSQALQIKNNIKASIIGYQKTLEFNKEELNRISSLEKVKYGKMPSNEKSLRSIERQQSIKESLYILLLQKREEAAINLAIINPSVKVVDYAIYTAEPIGPQQKGIYLTALLLGLLLPFGIIYVYNILDTKIHTKEDLKAGIPDITLIAEIPYIESENKTIEFIDRSVLSESFRILRTNIKYIVPASDAAKVLFVTSTIKGEGKTFVSINLALTLSALDKKVILVGADLRNPQLHKTLNVDRFNTKGVSNFLFDPATQIDDIKTKNLGGGNLKFDVIFSGIIPPNPAELLSNGRFDLLIAALKKEYDYVIVDTAPTLLITDTTLITHLSDSILYVIRANYTEKKLLKFISNLKDFNAIKNIGIILNDVGQNKGYRYGYSYNYGYGYGYENDDANTAPKLTSKVKHWLNRFTSKKS
ncbi:MAG: polysaccharide biosynthesis tyrosine autokinase [Flavobacterium sp.]|nr:polysaccharide biosynthesis tyrosine autokinase [Flavobacterium sp.]